MLDEITLLGRLEADDELDVVLVVFDDDRPVSRMLVLNAPII